MRFIAFMLLATALSTSALAAGEKKLPKMTRIAEWEGPFPETTVMKMVDVSEGVACYIYLPLNIATSTRCSGEKCGVEYKDSIGSISCVKVFEPNSLPKAR